MRLWAAKGWNHMQSDLRAVLEQLTDENNDQPIELINDRGEKATFAQMALIPVTTPSPEYEDEFLEHHYALFQPIDENGEDVGNRVIFDFLKDESGEVTVELVDNPYIMRSVMEIYRQRWEEFDNEDEKSVDECESIFGGMLTEEKTDEKSDEPTFAERKEQELIEYSSNSKKEQSKKKGFFGKLFGKK